jgi:hypothetical protein
MKAFEATAKSNTTLDLIIFVLYFINPSYND